VESIEAHPIRTLYDAGVKVTINTDDPTVCGVTLTDEYNLLVERFEVPPADIERMIAIGKEAAFHGGA
jgi:adenosine deaminase